MTNNSWWIRKLGAISIYQITELGREYSILPTAFLGKVETTRNVMVVRPCSHKGNFIASWTILTCSNERYAASKDIYYLSNERYDTINTHRDAQKELELTTFGVRDSI